MKQIRVLLIEDSFTDLEIQTRLLKRAGFSVTIASGGDEGIAIALAVIPSVILTDLNLITGNGVAVVKAVKSNEKTRHIPVIGITGHTEASRDEALAEGFDDLLIKPLDPVIFAKLVVMLCQQS